MSLKFSQRGKKTILESRYKNDRGEEIYQVFEGKDKKDLLQKAKKSVPKEHFKA